MNLQEQKVFTLSAGGGTVTLTEMEAYDLRYELNRRLTAGVSSSHVPAWVLFAALGNKINAIKELRAIHKGLGLAEAKRAVERLTSMLPGLGDEAICLERDGAPTKTEDSDPF